METRKGCVTLISQAPERLRDFYREVFGLELRFEGERFAELVAPDGFRLALMRSETPALLASGSALGFSVSDFDVARAELLERGLAIQEEEDRESGVRLIWFKDPEGRPLYLWEQI